MTLEELIHQRQWQQAQIALSAQQMAQCALIQQQYRPTAMEVQLRAQQQRNALPVGALGRIMLHNQQMNAIRQEPVKPEPPNPNAPPPRVTVQDIFDYHAEKDRTATPHRSIVDF